MGYEEPSALLGGCWLIGGWLIGLFVGRTEDIDGFAGGQGHHCLFIGGFGAADDGGFGAACFWFAREHGGADAVDVDVEHLFHRVFDFDFIGVFVHHEHVGAFFIGQVRGFFRDDRTNKNLLSHDLKWLSVTGYWGSAVLEGCLSPFTAHHLRAVFG